MQVVADLKKIYTAVMLDEAEEALLQFGEKWRGQYPACVKSWEENWEVLSTFYEYPPAVRKIIYTTNIIEGLNRQFRQITKSLSQNKTGYDKMVQRWEKWKRKRAISPGQSKRRGQPTARSANMISSWLRTKSQFWHLACQCFTIR